jgi:tRNA(adenine34) deaminase
MRACIVPVNADDAADRRFIAEAQRMKAQAIAAGDQPFGAVLVHAGKVVGFGPSRVETDGDPDAHAERVAVRDAQKRLGSPDLTGAILYSTSRPCAACERAAAQANVSEMRHGPDATSAGRPRLR